MPEIPLKTITNIIDVYGGVEVSLLVGGINGNCADNFYGK
jgi:hypothetical protein